MSEFEKFLLCERILINVTTKRQADFKDFEAFKNKKTLDSTRSCVNWAFLPLAF
jgi:hypothetical protein